MTNEEYKLAPDIFTNKDLDYLKDIFGWHHTAYKVCEDALTNIADRKVEKVVSDCSKLFYQNMQKILKILEEGNSNE